MKTVTKVTEGSPDGSKTVEKTVSETDGNGNSVNNTETVRTEKDGSKTTTTVSEIRSPDGSTVSSETSIVVRDESTGTTTVASSKTDSTGKVTSESVTTVISESKTTGSSSETTVSDESVEVAMKQISSVSGSIASAKKILRIESGNGSGITSDTVLISKAAMERISANDDVVLDVSTSSVRLILDSDSVSNLDDKGEITINVNSDVRSTLTEKQTELVGDGLVLDISIVSGSSEIHALGGTATVSVPFDIAGRDVDDLNVWYLDGNNLVWVGKVDYSDGMATFIVTHFSKYVIMEGSPQPVPADSGSDDNNSLLYAGIAIIAVLVAAICAILYKRRV